VGFRAAAGVLAAAVLAAAGALSPFGGGVAPRVAGAALVGSAASSSWMPAGYWSVQTLPSAQAYFYGISCPEVGWCVTVGSGSITPVASVLSGGSWSSAPILLNAPGLLSEVSCPTVRQCMAVGYEGGGSGLPVVEALAGGTWTSMHVPGSGVLAGVSCPSPTWCTAVGSDALGTGLGATTKAWVATFTGGSWTSQVLPAPPGIRSLAHWSISCPSVGACVAIGGTDHGALVETLSGTTWTAQQIWGVYLSEVSCSSPGSCEAVGGNFAGPGGKAAVTSIDPGGLVTSILPMPSGALYAELDGVSCPPSGPCVAVGKYFFEDLDGMQGGVLLANPTAGGWSLTTPDTAPIDAGTSQAQLWLSDVACAAADQCAAAGGAQLTMNGVVNDLAVVATSVLPTDGYLMAGRDGGVFTFGTAQYRGAASGVQPAAPVVAIAATPSRDGYWEAGADGGVYAFGDAGYFGSMGGQALAAPIVGMAPTADGGGYWLVGADGGVFAFGDATYQGSVASGATRAPVVAIVADAVTGGYWLIAQDGGVFAFGAPFFGSAAGLAVGGAIAGGAATHDGGGYWLVGADGGVFAFGDAPYLGSMAGVPLSAPVMGMAVTSDGRGYRLVAGDGGVFAFGDAGFYGSMGARAMRAAVVGVAGT